MTALNEQALEAAWLAHDNACPGEHWRKRDRMAAGIRAYMAALDPAPGWQPIETAPKDGTEFQSWITDGRGFGQWEPRSRFDPVTEAFELWGRVDYDQDGWDVYLHVTPTHWLPLPSPPRQAGDHHGA